MNDQDYQQTIQITLKNMFYMVSLSKQGKIKNINKKKK